MTIPDVTLVNQDGQPVNVARDLAPGKLLVMNFIFTTCKGVCPPMGVNFGQLQKRLAGRLGKGSEPGLSQRRSRDRHAGASEDLGEAVRRISEAGRCSPVRNKTWTIF